MLELKTRATELLGVRYPVVQTGMGWVSDARLTAATSAAGGLGILGSATMSFDELRASLDTVRSVTPNPFGVNFRSDSPDAERIIDLMIEQSVKVASFGRAPNARLIEKLRTAGIVTMPTVGAVRHAEKVVEFGVDAIIVQGSEGGGHTGAVPTSLLVPLVVDRVDVPVIAAGGYFDGRGLVAALAYGAEGIAMGTRFLLTQESPVHPDTKHAYATRAVTDTVVTKSVDGVPQRVLRTPLIDHLERSSAPLRFFYAARSAIRFRRLTKAKLGALLREAQAMKASYELSYAQMMMAPNAPMLTRAGLIDGEVEAGVLPSGQVLGLIDDVPTVADLLERIMLEAEQARARVSGTTS